MTVPHATSPVRLSLPLLINPHAEVRAQACAVLLATYGDRALTDLRRMTHDPDIRVRQQARTALDVFDTFAAHSPSPSPVESIYIECFGCLRIFIGCDMSRPQEWAALDTGRVGWQKMQAVFAYLVHCGRRGTSQVALGEAVWGATVSSAYIARTLTALRNVLEQISGERLSRQALLISREHCALDVEAYRSDVQAFEQALDLAEQTDSFDGLAHAAPLYAQAIQFYGGSYLADVLPGSGWARERRATFDRRFVAAAERFAEHLYAQRDDEQCALVCQQALEIDQRAEAVTAWLIRASARQGEFGECEYTYRRYLRITGIDPQLPEHRRNIVVQAYQEGRSLRCVTLPRRDIMRRRVELVLPILP